MSDPVARPAVGWLALMLLVGFSLRASLGSLPPIADQIGADLRLNATAAGALTSLAALCIGLFAPLAPRLGRRLGLERAAAAYFLLLGVALLARAALGSGVLLITDVAVAGIAMSGPTALIPVLIGARLPRRRGAATGLFSGGLAVGVACAGAVAVPLATGVGWRYSLAVWAVPAFVTAAVLFGAGVRPRPATVRASRWTIWRSRRAIAVAWFSVAVLTMGFAGMAWVAPYFVSLGYSRADAARHFVTFQAVQLVVMVAVPSLTDYVRARRPLMVLMAGSAMAGMTVLLVAPHTLGYLGTALWGMGVGGGSALGIVLIGDYADDEEEASSIASLTFLTAYTAGALSPIAVGFGVDRTGSFIPGFAAMLLIGLLLLATVPIYRPRRRPGDAPAAPRRR